MIVRAGDFPPAHLLVFLWLYWDKTMLTATPSTRLCCACTYWYGPRTASNDGHVYAMENARGYCQLHGYLDRPPVDYCDDWIQWSIPRIVPTNQQILNCWEYYSCGYEEGGKNAALHGICPAYPDHGHSCAYLESGTPALVLDGATQKTLCASPANCARCDFFNSGHHEKLIINPNISWASAWQHKDVFDEMISQEEDKTSFAESDNNHFS